MELTATLKTLFIETAASLKGSTRRLFMARTVRQLGPGGQRLAQRELGWNRETLRKGTHELQAGVTCCDAFRLRGCQPAEARLPHLLTDIQQIVDGQSQTDPQFRNQRLYTRLTAAAVRHQLIVQKGYTDAQLPLAETIGKKLNRLGYPPQKVRKSLPQKRLSRPTLSLPNGARSMRRRRRLRTYSAFLWMPTPRSTSAIIRAAAKIAFRSKRPIMLFIPRRGGRLWASCCLTRASCVCTP